MAAAVGCADKIDTPTPLIQTASHMFFTRLSSDSAEQGYVTIANLDGSHEITLDSGITCSSTNGKILWVTIDTSHRPRILSVANSDGGGIVRIAVPPGHGIVRFPQLSPDGSHVAYGVDSSNGDSPLTLFVRSSAGGMPVTISQQLCRNVPPAFSADGNRIAYVTQSGSSYALWTSSTDGTNPTRVTSIGYPYKSIFGRLSWSKTGWIAFVDDSLLEIVRADGTGKKVIASGHSPTWSPDGTKLACTYAIDRIPAPSALMGYYDLLTDSLVSLVSAKTPAWVLPAWSPDGRSVMCEVTSAPNLYPGDLMSVDITTRATTTLTRNAVLGSYAK